VVNNTTTAVVNNTVNIQKQNQTTSTSNKTQNSSYDTSTQTKTIQNDSVAAPDRYQNVRAVWISKDEAASVNLDELLEIRNYGCICQGESFLFSKLTQLS
jgi:hypothetical protein